MHQILKASSHRRIRVLMACSDHLFMPYAGCRYVGRLLTPIYSRSNFWHPYTSLDNCAFSGWSPVQFRKMLITYSLHSKDANWVACPDVVGNWLETAKRFKEWSPVISGLGYSVSYVLQDGQPLNRIPWSEISCVFLGGSTKYKLSSEAMQAVKTAKAKGKMVHIGRINSVTRIEMFLPVMDSFDGLSYSKWPGRKLPAVIRLLKDYENGKELSTIS